MKASDYDFKVGDIVVDTVGTVGVITELHDYVSDGDFRGFYFKWIDTDCKDEIEEFEELGCFHRVGEYVFADYDLDKAYGFLETIDKHIADLQEERAAVLKGIDYINHDTGETTYTPRSVKVDLVEKTLATLDNKDLKRLKLTPLEYETARLLLKEYWENGEAMTFWKGLADFFKKMGFTVEQTTDGVGWRITA